MHVLLLNGPPQCGKDTVANYLVGAYPNVYHTKIARPLQRAVAGLFNKSWHELEHMKDETIVYGTDIVSDYTYRDVMIALSEHVLKPLGTMFLMNQLKKRLDEKGLFQSEAVVVVSDLGFQSEFETFVDWVGEDNVTIVTIHRPDCNFDRDSRSHIRHENHERGFGLINNRDKKYLYSLIEAVVSMPGMEIL